MIITTLTLLTAQFYYLKKTLNNRSDLKYDDFKNEGGSTLLNHQISIKENEISELRYKLNMKKTFEDELIRTILEAETQGSLNSSDMINELKLKVHHQKIMEELLLKNNLTTLDENDVFLNELERQHPELNYQ